ncbi:MAG: DUF2490 domain-containing protein [Saprospiraceae bacterium]|nr:DUF2490 domain-containing protein [Saprospiraceae bacterium]
MMARFRFLIWGVLFLTLSHAKAQNTRIHDPNQIVWVVGMFNFQLKNKWNAHAEYQWRRAEWVKNWQQSLVRVGISRQIHNRVNLRFGYAWVETYPYGDYPINTLGRDFTEHRMFQAATLTDKIDRVDFTHRLMLEQRWLGRYSVPEKEQEDDYVFVNRLRYLLRLQIPLQGSTLNDRECYAALYDELLIGFGKNINENIFDQNRIGVLFGYRLNPTLRIEAGYISQILQLGREITLPGEEQGRNVFQFNSGLILTCNFNLTR